MFIQAGEHKFEIKINIGAIKRVKENVGIDLLLADDELKPESLAGTFGNPLTMAEIIACLLTPQFEEKGLDEQQVVDNFDGSTLSEATEAFFEELENFFEGLSRPAHAEAIRKMRRTFKLGQKCILEKIQEIDEEKIIRRGLKSIPLPDLSESAQTNTPGGN